MDTYYMDQRSTVNGTGATSVLHTATGPINTFMSQHDKIPNGDHVIEVIEGSGIYHANAYGSFPQQADSLHTFVYRNRPGNLTLNLNGCTLKGDIDLTDPIYGYVWRRSQNETYGELWYVTTATGGSLNWRIVTRAGQKLEPTSVKIGDRWLDSGMNLTATLAYDVPEQWLYDDLDALGFWTFYVRCPGGNPQTSGITISAAIVSHIYRVDPPYTSTFTVFDGIIGGTQEAMLHSSHPITVKRNRLGHCASHCVGLTENTAAGSVIANNTLVDSGHRGVYCNKNIAYSVVNNHFENVHLILLSASGSTPTLLNNTSKNLYAAAIQCASPTMVEDYNHFHLDPLSIHGTVGLALDSATTTAWPTTGAHSFPASTATNLGLAGTPSLDIVTAGGTIPNNSPLAHMGTVVAGVNDAGQLDIFGNTTSAHPNIGVDQGAAEGYGPWADFDSTITLPIQSTNAIGTITRTIVMSGEPPAAAINKMVEFGE